MTADYPKPYPCCDHCRAEDQFMGSHNSPCGYRGCPGSDAAGHRFPPGFWLLTVALLVFVVGGVVAQVGGAA